MTTANNLATVLSKNVNRKKSKFNLETTWLFLCCPGIATRENDASSCFVYKISVQP